MIDIRFDYASDDSCQMKLWAKGHHSQEEFLAACKQAMRIRKGKEVDLPQAPVIQQHWRTVPADAQTRAYGVCDFIHKECQPGPGAFKVTVLDGWLPIHSF